MKKIKKIIYCYALCTIFFPTLLFSAQHSKTIFARPGTVLDLQHTHINWDLHNNAVQHDVAAMLKKGLPYACNIMGLVGDKELCKKLKVLKDASAPGEAFTHLLKEHTRYKLARGFRKVACLQQPTPGILSLMAKINALNIPQRHCSNIGPEFLEDLKVQVPQLFEYLGEGTVALYNPEDGSSIMKPDSQFYKMHNERFNPDGTQTPILVDDKRENAEGAANAGWIGIHFVGSVSQLYKDFQTLGIEVYQE